MITYTPADLVELGEETTTVTCPYCGKDIELNIDDEETELVRVDGSTFHADCVYDLFTISEFLQYLSAKNQWQEFFEWYYDCKFDEFSDTVKENLRFAFEKLNGETDRNYTAFQYVEDNIEDYLRWYEEE